MRYHSRGCCRLICVLQQSERRGSSTRRGDRLSSLLSVVLIVLAYPPHWLYLPHVVNYTGRRRTINRGPVGGREERAARRSSVLPVRGHLSVGVMASRERERERAKKSIRASLAAAEEHRM